MPELAYVNGKYLPISEAFVSIDDRGYQFGDGVYEVISVYNGKPFLFAPHMQRLKNSLEGLRIKGVDFEEVTEVIQTLASDCAESRTKIYLSVTRGVAPRNHVFPEETKPCLTATIRKVPEASKECLEVGLKAITLPDYRWGRCDLKTLNLLWNVMAVQQAAEQGAKEAILLSEDDVVREGTSSNVFAVWGGKILTHPLTRNILPGITRNFIIESADKIGVTFSEEFFDKRRLLEADEIFVSGSIAEIAGICEVDGVKIGSGKTGPATKKIRKFLKAEMDAYCAQPPSSIYRY